MASTQIAIIFFPITRTLLEAATKNDRLLLEQALSSQYGRVSGDDLQEALLRAACQGNSKCVTRLLAEGTDPDCEDVDGDTPLMLAASNNYPGESLGTCRPH